MPKKSCPWCATLVLADCTGVEDPDPDTLCRGHLAEYEGLSEAELDRMEAEQGAELHDALYG